MSGVGRAIVVMGVAGAGKSTLGKALAEALGCPFIEGDDHHPESNKQKIASGIALDDSDRWPWLLSLCHAINRDLGAGPICVVTCSALRQTYRDYIKTNIDSEAEFVYLKVSEPELQNRLSNRKGHFAGISILSSQLATLELTPELIEVDAERSTQHIINEIRSTLYL